MTLARNAQKEFLIGQSSLQYSAQLRFNLRFVNNVAVASMKILITFALVAIKKQMT